MLILSRDEVLRLLDLGEMTQALAEGFKALSAGELDCPPRSQVAARKGALLSMPASMPGMAFSVKLVSIFHGNKNLPSHQAVVILFDAETGEPVALMDGSAITSLRTAACSMISIELLAKRELREAVIIGTGVQGAAHLAALQHRFSFQKIWLASHHPQQAERLSAGQDNVFAADSIRDAVERSDVVCLCTSSHTAVIEPDWVRPGSHITSVGYNPPGGELPLDLIRHSKLFVESRRAFDPPPSGSAELQGLSPEAGVELGEVLLGTRAGRASEDEITIYKSMGHAMEDLVAANLVFSKAIQTKAGVEIRIA